MRVKLFSTILFLFISINSFSQLLVENFDYGDVSGDLVSVSSGIWSNHSGGTGSNDILYVISGLEYPSYCSSGIGGAASLRSTRTGDNNRPFIAQNSGTIYYSFLVKVATVSSTNAEYFIHLGTTSPNNHYAKVYIFNSSNNLQFGLSKFSESPTFSLTNYSFNSTYLVIVKYIFNSENKDDAVSMWVFSGEVPETEEDAGVPDVANVTSVTDDASQIGIIALRQGSTSHNLIIDGIRVATSWSQAPLPVELTSFTASRLNNVVHLKWITDTEINNYGFEVQRSQKTEAGGQNEKNNWCEIGFVKGSGNSNSLRNYSFIDENISAGNYTYRLKQIDNDGMFKYSDVVEVNLEVPERYELYQNYPNPFNPATTIVFNLPKAGNIKLIIYNVLGQAIKILADEFKEAGTHSFSFDGSYYSSGLYFYHLETEEGTLVRKMTLIK